MLPVEKKPSNHRNKLSDEKSPYLLQHASNPVNWYPWCDEAFEAARNENKPIFLSIGYSTCHWCHVMEHESFEDEKVANLMNQTFISIKVDREERPDIDNIYMMVCQMITGSGGWPLTIMMTPDKRPFFAGTYIPKDARFGRIGMTQLVPRIKEIWENRRAEVLESAEKITEALTEASSAASLSDDKLDEATLKYCYENFAREFDPRYGGFGKPPKFPTPHNFQFLLRYWRRSGENMALGMAGKTLRSMYQGGIFDHIGFGFHRYSTDAQWRLPHFEKMLYDQALLAMAYIEMFQVTRNPDYRRAAQEIFEFVMRDLTDKDGGFHSAIDADSEGVEGKFYLWSEREIRDILPADDANLFIQIYNVKKEGNFEDPGAVHPNGKNILYLEKSIEDYAGELGLPENYLRERLEKSRKALFAYREKRIRPQNDDKILIDWNGLMIASLAQGAKAFNDSRYSTAAANAIDFILNRMADGSGFLLHRYRDGEAAGLSNINDYAFLVWGLLELYEATFDYKYFARALDLNHQMISRFWDSKDKGFYFVADDADDLIVRQKEIYDGALPSGNSVAALNLLRIARMTANEDFEKMARDTIELSAGSANRSPQTFTHLLMALDYELGPSFEIVLVGDPEAADFKEISRILYSNFVPNKIVIQKYFNDEQETPAPFGKLINDFKSPDGKATAYICSNYSCGLPTSDTSRMLDILGIKI